MKKVFLINLVAIVLLSSCATSGRVQGGRPNGNAMATGAMVGGSVGNIIGGTIGSANNGWWGGRRGSAIGTVVGTIAGAAIGGAVSSAQNREQQPRTSNYVETIQPTNTSSGQSSISPLYGLKITNIRFVDDGRNQIINANEHCKIVFDVMNESNATIFDVIPVVKAISGSKYIEISPSVMIESIAPGDGIRYTANLYANKKMKTGEVVFGIELTNENGAQGDFREFTLPTQK